MKSHWFGAAVAAAVAYLPAARVFAADPPPAPAQRRVGARAKYLFAGIAGLFALAAVDAAHAQPPGVPGAYSWAGSYIGGNVGYGWGVANDNLSASQLINFGATYTDTLAASDSNKFSGVIGGVQAGYNWQVHNFLFGIETDIQASGQTGTNSYGATIVDPTSPNFNNAVVVTDSAKLDWFGTARGRFGVTGDRWLAYVTGGLAYGEVKESGTAQPTNAFTTVLNAPFVWNSSTTKVGWVVGVGVENAISTNWSWKVEYLFMDLGNVRSNVSGGVGSTVGFPSNCYGGAIFGCHSAFSPGSGGVTSGFTDSIVRVGINYKLN
jgi:outer membrane immunogenic protein